MNAGESMNRLWSGMLLLGIAYGAFCGKLPEVTDGALRASKEAVVLAISLLGVTGLWSGLMEIARKAGMIDSLVKKMGPVMRFFFPKVPSDHPAIQSAATNMICNVFGLGAAATPPGLLAMEQFEELEEERRKNKNPAAVPKGTANREMCTFLIFFPAADTGQRDCIPQPVWQRASNGHCRTGTGGNGSKHGSGCFILQMYGKMQKLRMRSAQEYL